MNIRTLVLVGLALCACDDSEEPSASDGGGDTEAAFGEACGSTEDALAALDGAQLAAELDACGATQSCRDKITGAGGTAMLNVAACTMTTVVQCDAGQVRLVINTRAGSSEVSGFGCVPDLGSQDAGVSQPDASAQDATVSEPDTGTLPPPPPPPPPANEPCYNPEGTVGLIVDVAGGWGVEADGTYSGLDFADQFCTDYASDLEGQDWFFGFGSSCDPIWNRFGDSPGECFFHEAVTSCPGENSDARLELQFDGEWEGSLIIEVLGGGYCQYEIRVRPEP